MRTMKTSPIKPITPANMHKLALELIDLLHEKDLYGDTIIYVGTKLKIQKDLTNDVLVNPKQRPVTTPHGLVVYETEFDGKIPTEYNNPKTLTVTFEDDLYIVMNQFGKLHDELNNLFSKYSLYLEMGHAWDFSIYPV